MGCNFSEATTRENDFRSKMLVEYLKGVDARPIKEVNSMENGHAPTPKIPNSLQVGETFMADKYTEVRLISHDERTDNLKCLVCKLKFNQNVLSQHLNTKFHKEAV